jgi:hypothetical protein
MQEPKTIRRFPWPTELKKIKSYCSGYVLHFFIPLTYIFFEIHISTLNWREIVNSNCSLIVEKINMYINFDNKENNFRTRMRIAFIFVLGLVAATLECYFALCRRRGLCTPTQSTEDISNRFFCPWLLRKENTFQAILLFFFKLYGKLDVCKGHPLLISHCCYVCSSLH